MAFPILAGLALGALMGGGIAALQKKDILQGALMGAAGGALGGAFMPGVAGAAGAGAVEGATASGFGATGLSQGATAGAVNAFESQLPGIAGISGTGGTVGGMAPMGAAGQGLASLGGAVPTAAPFNLTNFLTQNKGALMGGVTGGMMAPGQEPDPAEQGNIRDYTYSQSLNPEFGSVAGAPYFKQGYTAGAITPVEDYTAANGGIIALAEGGQALAPYQPVETNRYNAAPRGMTPEVAAYNQQLMARANQQYNVNPRPLPMQVPGTAEYIASRPASASAAQATGPRDYIDEYYQQMLGRNADPTGRGLIESAVKRGDGYDPARDIAETIRSSEEFKLSGKNPNPTGIEIDKVYSPNQPAGGKSSGYSYDPVTRRYSGGIGNLDQKSEIDKLREEMNMMRGGSSYGYGDSGEGGTAGPGSSGSPSGDQSAEGMGIRGGGSITQRYNIGGMSSLGAYSDGGQLLKGPGDGVSDDIPAQIGRRQPARLADNEFVLPARIVSEIGNGSTDAGAKRLYQMMDRVQKRRGKTVGKGKIAVDSKAHKELERL